MLTSSAKVLIANRGEIAIRVIRACRELSLPCVLAYSEADRNSLPVQMADEAVCIGAGPSAESYLKLDRIFSAASMTGATAIHPGYGFLSENPHFAEVCEDCGLIFVGPSARAIRTLGNKAAARRAMQAAGVPVVPGSDRILSGLEEARECAAALGYPVILKATNGGGGKGMRIVMRPEELPVAYANAGSEAEKAFGDGSLYMEKYQINPRHVEFQIMADRYGNVIHLGDRDCSLQRHHQKIIEEAPCPALSAELRETMGNMAVRAAQAVNYVGAGTIEFLLTDDGQFYFMEMNTRIQVEHPVTEAVTGCDIVREQLKVALGEQLSWRQEDIRLTGHAIEVRVNAEDPKRNFAPCPGRVGFFLPPGGPGIRVDSHLYSGYVIPPYYDSLLAKVIAHAPTRGQAIIRARNALREFIAEGVTTTIPFARELLNSDEFTQAKYNTGTLDSILNS